MGSLDGLHVQVHDARFGIASHRRIPRVGEWAGLAVAQTADVIFIAAEILVFCRSREKVEIVSENVLFFLSMHSGDQRSCGLNSQRVKIDTHLSLYEQNCWLMTCQTISSDMMGEELATEKVVDPRVLCSRCLTPKKKKDSIGIDRLPEWGSHVLAYRFRSTSLEGSALASNYHYMNLIPSTALVVKLPRMELK